jgi:hypothetical protein
MKLSNAAKILAADLALYVVLGILLTPAGQLETRSATKVTVLGIVTLAVFFVGLLGAIFALVFLFRRSRRGRCWLWSPGSFTSRSCWPIRQALLKPSAAGRHRRR